MPNICKKDDQDIEILLDDIFMLGEYLNIYSDISYSDLFQLKNENGHLVIDTIANIRNFKTNLYNKLSKLDNDATKKDIAKVFKDVLISNNNGLGKVLIYLSGLWRLVVLDSQNNNVSWRSFSSRVKLSELDDYFLKLSKTDAHTSFTIHTDEHCYIEPVILGNEIDKVSFTSKDSESLTHFSKIKFRDIEIFSCELNKSHIYWWCGENKSFNIEDLILKADGKGNITSEGCNFENFQMKIANLDKSVKLSNNSCSLLLKGTISKLSISDCNFTKLDFQNCEFTNIPDFDDKSSIKHSVDIDKKSFDNLLNIEKAGSLEFSRLAEFFNRNNAYMEAQQLHRHYLLAKAKESKNYGLKFWVWLYNFINGCGTSLVKPAICMLLLFIANLFIVLLGSNLCGFDITYLAINTTIPIFKLISNPVKLSNGVLLLLNISSILTTLIWFLIALQIRKLLRLKE